MGWSPIVDGNVPRDSLEKKKCYNCKEEGHFASECVKAPTRRENGKGGCGKASEAGDESGRKSEGSEREIYIPTEIDESQLYENGIASGINFDDFDAIEVSVTGSGSIPSKIRSFEELSVRELLLSNIIKSGYTKPTPIQKSAMPVILGDRDVMGCAQTGSGKTAAFLIPILHSLLSEGTEGLSERGSQPQKPRALIVAPTRELAVQIKDEARKFSRGSMIRPNVIYGGTSTFFQMNQMIEGVDLLVATPGRLLDFTERKIISFERVKFLVLDEADRMLDMGFLPEIRKIVSEAGMPDKYNRQTLMFSATFQDAVQTVASEFLKEYVFITVGVVGGVNKDVVQTFYQVSKYDKREKLKEILDEVGTGRTLVFVQTKRSADFIAAWLSENGFPTTSIHGDRFQSQRETALLDFRRGKMPILVATAVAARGLDIKGVTHVVNYDLPTTVDEYVHRVGRTGRVGNQGRASSFYDSAETCNKAIIGGLIRVLSDGKVDIPQWLADEQDASVNVMEAGVSNDCRSRMEASWD